MISDKKQDSLNKALKEALRSTDHPEAERLISAGADVNAYNGYIIKMSGVCGDVGALKFLIDAGAQVDYLSGALHLAAHRWWVYSLTGTRVQDYRACVDLLIIQGADLNRILRDKVGMEVLLVVLKKHAATGHNGIEVVMMLEPKYQVEVLRQVYPDLSDGVISDEIAMLEAMALSPDQKAQMWRSVHQSHELCGGHAL